MSDPVEKVVVEPAKRFGKGKVGGRRVGSKSLTVAQKAEAVALWRAGEVTLDDLSERFKKRPETFSRLFKKMGIKKGSAIHDAAKKMAAEIEARALSSVEEHQRKILAAKEEHFKMSSGLAKLAWAEIVRARQAGLDLGGLKEIMQTLKLASEVIGISRKEVYAVLNIEEHDKQEDLQDLPELTVRELTQVEVEQLRDAGDDDTLDTDPGGDMLGDVEEGV